MKQVLFCFLLALVLSLSLQADDVKPTSPTLVSVDDANVFFSPYNTLISKSPSYAEMVSINAYCKFNFNGTRLDIHPEAVSQKSPKPSRIRIIIDDATDDVKDIADDEVITFDKLSLNNHTVQIFLIGGCNRLRITGFEIYGGTGLVPYDRRTETNLFFGDSLSDYGPRDDVFFSEMPDSMTTYANLVADALGEYGLVANSGAGWMNSYFEGTPTFPNSWANYESGKSRLVNGKLSPPPHRIVINIGTSDEASSDVTPSVVSTLNAIRTAAPHARIYVMIPFNRNKSDQIKAGFEEWKDGNSKLVDLGEDANKGYGPYGSLSNPFSTDGIHNTQTNNARLAVMLMSEIQKDISAREKQVPLSQSATFFGRWDLRDQGRAITVNSGSYIWSHFTSDSISAHFDMSSNGPERPTVAWKIDQGDWQVDEIRSVLPLAKNLSAGPHTVCLMVRGMNEQHSRWTPPLVSSVTFLGFDLEAGSFLPPLDEWIHPKLKMEFLGDSITEGVLVQPDQPKNWSWKSDALHSYACETAMNLGAAWRQVGFGATGLTHGGNGGAPDALDSFNFFYQGCPRDDWQPDVVVVNQGTNDPSDPAVNFQVKYTKYMNLIRQAYPGARIVALRPLNGAHGDHIKQSVLELNAAGDKNIFFVDSTGWYTQSDLHPSAQYSTNVAEKLAAAIKAQVLSN